MELSQYEILQIRDAFKRCYGLQSALQSAATKDDSLFLQATIEATARQSGLRVEHIKNNIEEICKL